MKPHLGVYLFLPLKMSTLYLLRNNGRYWDLFEEPVILKIAKCHQRTPAQVISIWGFFYKEKLFIISLIISNQNFFRLRLKIDYGEYIRKEHNKHGNYSI